ncbi:hypothetical protein [Acinetobacter junii]|uniref:hypothetical protein n=1 Tax=Acinetobacter junii TaxID=40215 RepID=UPI00300BC080
MRSEFDTLEQYQESMKEFNENTRMGFEEFIQSHGSDRNKLQLRCTPYTSKKGGYGSFDLDFGLCVYKHQQSKVDGLHKISVALNNETIRQREQVAYYLSKNAELQKRVDAVKQLIEDYRDPPTEDKTFQHALSIVTDELEQALKGGW